MNAAPAITPDFKDFPSQLKAEINERISSNLFPVDVFPALIQEIIKSTHENLKFPTDFTGLSIIGAGSLAIGSTHKAEVKVGWIESATTYAAIVAPPGTNKSHPLSFIFQPILERDKSAYKIYEQQRKEYDKALGLPRKEREKQIEEPVKPVWIKFLLSDYTPEALAAVHKFNLRGIGVCNDELAGFTKNFNKYNNGSEVEFWLSGWSGKPINIDRKGGESIFISHPSISVIGTIQTAVLNELAKNGRGHNGFIDRFLFAFPDNIQKEYWSETEISPSISENWNQILSTLLDLPLHLDHTLSPEPAILKFTTEAKTLLYKWQRENTDQCNEAESEAIRGIGSKLEVYVVRLSLILQMLRFACGESDKQAIGVESVNGAVKLAEYFKKSALKVNAIISNKNPLERQSLDRQMVYEALPERFTTAEGVAIALDSGMPERNFKRFLNEAELFTNTKRGNYEKRI